MAPARGLRFPSGEYEMSVGTIAVQVGASILFSFLGNMFAKPARQVVEGPRLDDKRLQLSTYGAPIPRSYGSVRLTGNVIWSSDLIETRHEETVSSGGGGGKGGGGGGGSTQTTITYTYSINCAVAVCEGPIKDIVRIWADQGKVIYENGSYSKASSIRIYRGTPDQPVDSMLAAYKPDTPAYRGTAYVVIEGLQLKDFGNRLPQLEFEVVGEAQTDSPSVLDQLDTGTSLYPDSATVSSKSGILVYAGDKDGFLTVEEYRRSSLDVVLQASAASTIDLSETDSRWSIFSSLSPSERYLAIYYAKEEPTRAPAKLVIYDRFSKTFGTPFDTEIYQDLSTTFDVGYGGMEWVSDDHLFILTGQPRGQDSDTDDTDTIGLLALLRTDLNLSEQDFVEAVSGLPPAKTAFVKAIHRASLGEAIVFGFNIDDLDADHMKLFSFKASLADGAIQATAPDYFLDAGALGAINSDITESPLIVGGQVGADRDYFWQTPMDWSVVNFRAGTTGSEAGRAVYPATNIEDWFLAGYATDYLIFKKQNQIKSLFVSTDGYGDLDPALDLGGTFTAQVGDFFYNIGGDYYLTSAIGAEQSPDGPSYDTGTPNPDAGTVSLVRIPRTGTISLDRVVESICDQAGLQSDEYDVTDLSDEDVLGYIIPRNMPGRQAIEPLQACYFFDAIETAGKIYFKKREYTAVRSFDLEDMGAGVDQPAEKPLQITRLNQEDLPAETVLTFFDKAKDYQQGAQRAKRIDVDGRNVANVEHAIVLEPGRAKAVAERMLYSTWQSRVRLDTSILPGNIDLDPGDCIDLAGRLARIMSISWKGVLELETIQESSRTYSTTAEVDEPVYVPPVYTPPAETVLEILDAPMLLDDDNRGVFYFAMCGNGPNWPGATVYESPDGENWRAVYSTSIPTMMGYVVSPPGDSIPEIIDNENEIVVEMLNGELESVSEELMLTGENWAMLGNEMIAFRYAENLGGKRWRLTGLLRGQRGTDWATGGHQAGERFIMLNAALGRLELQMDDRGVGHQYKAITFGTSMSGGVPFDFAPQFVSLKPLSPAHLQATPDPVSGDWDVSWLRRARMNASWKDGTDVPLDEPWERYEIEFLDGSNNVVRTETVSDATEFTYTAAMQTADFGSAQSTVRVRVYQISSRIGRGYAASGTFS
jgi:hypothetical protein